jgi:uncharacterized protein (TIGR02300 family)
VAKPQWGSKHICHSCGTRFYDLLRDPIVCPNCGAEFDPEALLKTRRSRAVTSEREEPVKRAKVRAPEIDAAEEAEVVQEEPVEQGETEDDQAPDENDAAEEEEGDNDAAEEEDGEKEEEKEDLIEDASELGEDEDDMAEVIDQVDPEEER